MRMGPEAWPMIALALLVILACALGALWDSHLTVEQQSQAIEQLQKADCYPSPEGVRTP